MPGKGGDLINNHLLGPAGAPMREIMKARRIVDLEVAYLNGNKGISWEDVRKRYSLSANYQPETQYKKGITK